MKLNLGYVLYCSVVLDQCIVTLWFTFQRKLHVQYYSKITNCCDCEDPQVEDVPTCSTYTIQETHNAEYYECYNNYDRSSQTL